MRAPIGVAAGMIVLAVAACDSRRPPASSDPTPTDTRSARETPPTGKPFSTPQAAVEALTRLVGRPTGAGLEELFGAGATEVFWSGDDVADHAAATRVKTLIDEGVHYERMGEDVVIAELGKDRWPLPFPIVRTSEGWRFHLELGKDELRTRRIGRNELDTIQTLYEYVDAQKEYRAVGRDGNPAAYAQKIRSTDGKHDGLYWAQTGGEEESPFGDEVAAAQKQGYDPSAAAGLRPFHGYYYRILTGQGPNASGGTKSYLDAKGLMTLGHAAVAWPASYGDSGVKTFLVNQTGLVFEKDLGTDTGTLGPAITEYDPDKTWRPVARPKLEDEDE